MQFKARHASKPLNLSGFTQSTSQEKITIDARIKPSSGKGKQGKQDFDAPKIIPLGL
jgi:hypothetical protein